MRARGHLEERSPGRWSLRLRGRRIALGRFSTRSAARAAADGWIARAAASLTDGPTVSAAEVFERFLRIDAHNVRPASARRYRWLLRRFAIPQLGTIEVRALGTARLREHLAELAGTGVARSTLIGIRAVILQALRSAEADGIAQLPAVDARRIRIPPNAAPSRAIVPIRSEELSRLLAASGWPWRCLWALLGFGGLRIGEALGLQWGDVDLKAHRLTIARAAVDGQLTLPKTRGSAAELPLLAPLEAVLTEYRQAWAANDLDLLFATSKATPHRADNIRRRVLHPLLDRLRLRRRGFHCFRHGLPEMLFDLGLSADVVQRLMRHSSLTVTNRYSHRSDDLRLAVNAAIARRQAPSATVRDVSANASSDAQT